MFCASAAMAATTGPDDDFAELPLNLLFIVGFHDIDYHLQSGYSDARNTKVIITDAMDADSVTYVGRQVFQRSVHSVLPATIAAYRLTLIQKNLRSHVGVILFYPCYIVTLGVLMWVRCHVVTVTNKVVSFGP